jgi:hypothetical protein
MNIYKSITYDTKTKIASGTLEYYVELNRKNPGTTENIEGASSAIKCYLLNYSTAKMQKWGKARLDFIFKHEYKINPNEYITVIKVFP